MSQIPERSKSKHLTVSTACFTLDHLRRPPTIRSIKYHKNHLDFSNKLRLANKFLIKAFSSAKMAISQKDSNTQARSAHIAHAPYNNQRNPT